MNDRTYQKFIEAKNNKDLNTMEELYYSNSNDKVIKFEYAKLLILKGKKDLGKKLLLELLETKSETYAKLELGRLEASIGNIEQARMYFESLLKTKSKIPALRELIVLEYNLKNYLKVLELIKLKKYIIDDKLIISISKELNTFFKDINYYDLKYNYSINQILDYDEYIAIEHILERHCNSEEKSNFNKNIDIFKLFNNIKNMLNEEYKINKLQFNDYYLIPYEIIGSKGENYLLVVTLPNTKDIITMYPVFNQYDDCEEEKNYCKK